MNSREGRRIYDEVVKVVPGRPNSCIEYRRDAFSPRRDIVKKLLVYLKKVQERFPGSPSVDPKFKRFKFDEDVFDHVKYKELDFVGYSGHLAMQLLRDEFPKDFFILESTERGPRLFCEDNANAFFRAKCSFVRDVFGQTPTFLGEDSAELRQAVRDYRSRCEVESDELVSEICRYF